MDTIYFRWLPRCAIFQSLEIHNPTLSNDWKTFTNKFFIYWPFMGM